MVTVRDTQKAKPRAFSNSDFGILIVLLLVVMLIAPYMSHDEQTSAEPSSEATTSQPAL
jgi:hypothetical protein